MVVDFKNNGVTIDCLMLCETFLNNSFTDLYNIPEYNLTFINREQKPRGGVAMYIHEKHDFIVRKDLSTFIEGQFESIFVEIKLPKPAIVGEIYRVPNSNATLSIKRYDDIIQKLNNYRFPVLIGTDQNFDLLKIDSHQNTQTLYDIFISNGFMPSITSPTRITHNTATLIDNIYLSGQNNLNSHSGILSIDISDHLPVFVFNNYGILSKNKPVTFKYRNINPQTLKLINNTLKHENWDFLTDATIHEASDEFVSVINKAINSHTTVKEIKLSPKNVKREKWMTQGLLKSAQSVQKLFKKQIGVSKESPKHTRYVEHRNLYNYLKRKAKQQYYSEVFEKHKSDVRNTWRELNRLIAKSNDKTTIIKSININGEIVTDPQKQANSFAQYFGDIGLSYNKEIPKSKKKL